MKRTTPVPADKGRKLARKASRALGFINLNPAASAHGPALATISPPAGVVPPEPARTPVAPHSPALETTAQAKIAPEDWDILFCAIQLRLRRAIADRTAAAPLPSDNVADGLDVLVLECVSDMGRLHAALKHERLRGAEAGAGLQFSGS